MVTFNPATGNTNFDDTPAQKKESSTQSAFERGLKKGGYTAPDKYEAQYQKGKMSRQQIKENTALIKSEVAKSEKPTVTIIQQVKEKRSYQVERQAANRKNPLRVTAFGKALGVGQPRKALTAKDHLKILRYRNRLEKEKLKNALQKFKIARQIDLARKKGILPAQQVMANTAPIKRLKYPAYSTPMEQKEIDSFK
jgi:hypothetical protein